MSNRIQFSNGVELSKGNEISQNQRMLSYAKRFKGIRWNKGRKEIKNVCK